MRILLTMQYDGTPYHGFQRQPTVHNTVQEHIESALGRILGIEPVIFASGRTDAAVHAIMQTAHFDTDKSIEPYKIISGCNHFLPESIRIMDARIVDDNLHARYSAKRKTYEYLLYTGAFAPLLINRAYHIPYDIDINIIRQGLAKLVGKHNFASYMSKGSSVKGTIRTVFDASISASDNPYNSGTMYRVSIAASGFLYNMVRLIVAQMLRIGRGELGLDVVDFSIANIDKIYTLHKVPAYGLYLKSIQYDNLPL